MRRTLSIGEFTLIADKDEFTISRYDSDVILSRKDLDEIVAFFGFCLSKDAPPTEVSSQPVPIPVNNKR